MAHNRVKKGRKISGWLVLDKPLGLGSTQAVSKIKWLFGAQKVGHAGTLDPLATGVLPIALGEATKTVPYVMDGTKAYQFTARWGAQTTTDDTEGEVINTSAERPTKAQIEALIPAFTGDVEQTPPQFSAIRIDGDRAYDLARKGEDVKLDSRVVEIDEIRILSHGDEETVFEIECGKGTYVRALARDFGLRLGCLGHVTQLRRTFVSPFDIDRAITMETLLAIEDEAGEDLDARHAALDALLLNAGDAMEDLPRLDVSDDQARRVRLGNAAIIRGRDAPLHEDEICAFHKNTLLAIGEISHGEFRPKRVFNL